jgi:hypothetical protein
VKTIIVSVFLMALSTAAMASASSGVPEIDAASGTTAVTLLLGGLLLLRTRRKHSDSRADQKD